MSFLDFDLLVPLIREYHGLGLVVISIVVNIVSHLYRLFQKQELHIHIKHLLIAIVSLSIFYLLIIVSSPPFVNNTFDSGEAPLGNFILAFIIQFFLLFGILEVIQKNQLFQVVSRRNLIVLTVINICAIFSKYLSISNGRGNEFDAYISIIEFNLNQFKALISILFIVTIFVFIKLVKNDQKYINRLVLSIQLILLVFLLSVQSYWIFVERL